MKHLATALASAFCLLGSLLVALPGVQPTPAALTDTAKASVSVSATPWHVTGFSESGGFLGANVTYTWTGLPGYTSYDVKRECVKTPKVFIPGVPNTPTTVSHGSARVTATKWVTDGFDEDYGAECTVHIRAVGSPVSEWAVFEINNWLKRG